MKATLLKDFIGTRKEGGYIAKGDSIEVSSKRHADLARMGYLAKEEKGGLTTKEKK